MTSTPHGFGILRAFEVIGGLQRSAALQFPLLVFRQALWDLQAALHLNCHRCTCEGSEPCGYPSVAETVCWRGHAGESR